MMKRKQNFTEDEKAYFVEYLTNYSGDGQDRFGNNLYKQLTLNAAEFPWAATHSWQSWREQYVKNYLVYDERIRRLSNSNQYNYGSEVDNNDNRNRFDDNYNGNDNDNQSNFNDNDGLFVDDDDIIIDNKQLISFDSQIVDSSDNQIDSNNDNYNDIDNHQNHVNDDSDDNIISQSLLHDFNSRSNSVSNIEANNNNNSDTNNDSNNVLLINPFSNISYIQQNIEVDDISTIQETLLEFQNNKNMFEIAIERLGKWNVNDLASFIFQELLMELIQKLKNNNKNQVSTRGSSQTKKRDRKRKSNDSVEDIDDYNSNEEQTVNNKTTKPVNNPYQTRNRTSIQNQNQQNDQSRSQPINLPNQQTKSPSVVNRQTNSPKSPAIRSKNPSTDKQQEKSLSDNSKQQQKLSPNARKRTSRSDVVEKDEIKKVKKSNKDNEQVENDDDELSRDGIDISSVIENKPRRRQKFTIEDDKILTKHLTKANREPDSKFWEWLEKHYPNHTAFSWRNRFNNDRIRFRNLANEMMGDESNNDDNTNDDVRSNDSFEEGPMNSKRKNRPSVVEHLSRKQRFEQEKLNIDNRKLFSESDDSNENENENENQNTDFSEDDGMNYINDLAQKNGIKVETVFQLLENFNYDNNTLEEFLREQRNE